MSISELQHARRFRVWVVSYDGWLPAGPRDMPHRAVALEPAEAEPMSAEEASEYAEAFNRAMLAEHRKLWAVGVPVEMRFEGEPQPGEMLSLRSGPSRAVLRKRRAARKKNPSCASQVSAHDGSPPRERT